MFSVLLTCVMDSLSSFSSVCVLRLMWVSIGSGSGNSSLPSSNSWLPSSSGCAVFTTGSNDRSKRAPAAGCSDFDFPEWRWSVKRVLATDRSRQIFLPLSLFASRSPDAFRLRLSRDTYARYKIIIQTTNRVIKVSVDELTVSLLATADIGSGSSSVGPFPPTNCPSYTRTSHRDDMLLSTFAFSRFV